MDRNPGRERKDVQGTHEQIYERALKGEEKILVEG
jgi:hypothetical protein